MPDPPNSFPAQIISASVNAGRGSPDGKGKALKSALDLSSIAIGHPAPAANADSGGRGSGALSESVDAQADASTAVAGRPEISVVMTVYNGARFLAEAVDSVLRQTLTDFEFIIVDDGSTDASVSILQEFERNDRRIRLVQQGNSGIAAALNRALMEAACDLVAHIDHDDRVLPQWLEMQLAYYRRYSECSVVCSYGYFLNTAGTRFGFSGNPVDVERGRKELDPSLFVELIHSSVLMRRADVLKVGGYRSLGAEDRDLWGRIVTAGMMIRCNPMPLVEYRLHGASEVARKRSKQQKFARHGVDINIVRRLKGEPELTPHQVELLHNSKPLPWKIRNSGRVAAGKNFRLAARHFSEGDWLPFFGRLLLAFLLRPLYVFSRSRRKMWHRPDTDQASHGRRPVKSPSDNKGRPGGVIRLVHARATPENNDLPLEPGA